MAVSTDALYVKYKPLLFSLAYRMTGSRAEAEDVVQEVFLQWARRPAAERELEHPKAYLCRMAVNRCTDLARSARARRETYVGPWLPEPLLGAPAAEGDPAAAFERDETLSIAMLLLMERLSPVERAVFVLREAFGFGYDEVAAMLEKTPANVRKIMSRVRAKLDGERADIAPPDAGFAEELLLAFRRATSTGDLEPLFRRLAPDVVLLSDGGGKTFAATVPIHSQARVAAFLGGLARKMSPDDMLVPAVVNGEPALVALEGPERAVRSVMAFRLAADGSIRGIYIVRNPDKLRHVSEGLRIP
ncbi:RNA polymerase sigma factor SigJ [Paenibacillus sp.]|uniref:RNA polymerase sigma factor SigJ n=1 Tax=Paenibacillus sp. TaxID=58172 RepID=UPI002D4D5417|nr:RNA polymerase sigma factor SigJ [Paenibacillus sp.]HZG58562.1 RNA polymerase sigma factor SigJ [Paenibacillus sp.]